MNILSSFLGGLRTALGMTVLLFFLVSHAFAAPGGGVLSGTLTNIAAGSVVDLTTVGEIDWVHWGLFTETSLDRKANAVPMISDFTIVDSGAGFAYVYQFSDQANGYSWTDGTPTAAATDTTTGVWVYGTPQIGSGFLFNVPADTATRTLKVYLGVFGARGKFEASLSDASAPAYSNTSLFNPAGGSGAFYTLTYAAASAGRTLAIRWTLFTPSSPQGNVTLHAAALTSSTANNPPFVALTNPVNNSTFPAGANLTLSATARDTDGTVGKVEFFADGTKLGEDPGSPYSFAWNAIPAGLHVLTATATDNQGAVSSSKPVEIFVNGTGGSLQATLTVPTAQPTAVNLTAEGTGDWSHWGLSTNSLFNHKANTLQLISDLTKIGTNAIQIFSDAYTGFSWTDGSPTQAVNHTTTGVYTTGMTNGFELTVPADTAARTLKVYVGLYGAQGNFQAWLGDFSAPAYTDTTLSNYFGNAYGVYTISYAAKSAGQTLKLRYRSLTLFDQDFGNVTWQAASLVTNTSGAALPVTLLNPTLPGVGFQFSFATQAGRSYVVQSGSALTPLDWVTVTNVTGTGEILSFTNHSIGDHRFFRVQTQ